MKALQNKLKFTLPPIITLVLFGIILAVKGIYPFGNKTIDYYDMAQQFVPFYYHVYDALHGTKGLFFDWYTALGTNMSAVSNCSNLSPFNLFFLFIKRENMLQAMSVFTLIKLMCMSASMYFYSTKATPKTPYSFRVIASVCYAFCGFVLLNYTIHPWLDIAALFPVLMYFYNELIKHGKIPGYTLMLALTLIISYYQGALVLVFLFLYTGMLLVRDHVIFKTRSDSHIFELGIGTLAGTALSSFIIVPQFAQMMQSTRFKNGTNSDGLWAKYIDILSHIKGDYSTRWWTLLGVSFAVAVIVTGMIRYRKDRQMLFTSVSLLVLTLAELFVESTNLLMHFGSYVHYPIRNGYMICFVFGYLMCEYAARLFGDDTHVNSKPYISLSTLPIAVTVFVLLIRWMAANRGSSYVTVLHITAFMMAVSLLYYLLILNLPFFKRLHVPSSIHSLSWCMIACEILCFGYLMLGTPDFVLGYAESPEQSNNFIYLCDSLRDDLDLEPDRIHRIKNPDESLNSNYGFVIMQPALSGWTAMIDPAEQKGAAKLGYSYQYTRLLDSGGTVFSDALIGIDKVLSMIPMDETLYEPVKRSKTGHTLYRPKYTLPFGVLIKDDPNNEWDCKNAAELHNVIYHSIRNSFDKHDPAEDEIATWLVKDTEYDVIDVNVTGSSALYLFGIGGDKDDRRFTIEILDDEATVLKTVSVPDIGNPENTGYPAYFNNNAIYLGCFENESVRIHTAIDRQKGPRIPISIMGLDLEKLEKLCKDCNETAEYDIQVGKADLRCTVDTADSDANTLLLPIAYNKGWNARVNGHEVSLNPRAGLLTAVPLSPGINNIEMDFTPPGMITGSYISLLALALTIIYMVVSRRRKITIPTITVSVINKIYIYVFIGIMLIVYVIPAMYTIYRIL